MNYALSFSFLAIGAVLAIVSYALFSSVEKQVKKEDGIYIKHRGRGDPYYGQYGVHIVDRSAKNIAKGAAYKTINLAATLCGLVGYGLIMVGAVTFIMSIVYS